MNNNLKIGLIVGGIVLGVLILIPLIIGSLTGPQYTHWGMMGPGMMWGFGLGWFMPLAMLLFWGLVIWGIIALVRGLDTQSSCKTTAADPVVETVKRRYTKDDIARMEYEQKKKDLD